PERGYFARAVGTEAHKTVASLLDRQHERLNQSPYGLACHWLMPHTGGAVATGSGSGEHQRAVIVCANGAGTIRGNTLAESRGKLFAVDLHLRPAH
ncbi:hypothetical protein NL355_27570, partial [Klebsiella pneumoniae]|nr:hypothetical protein [Klebsiella pneumoniae]